MKTSIKSGLKLAVLFLLLGVCAGAAAVFAWRAGVHTTPVTITSELIGERLSSVQDLVTVEYYYTDVDKVERGEWQVWGVNIPFTGSRAILSYEGVIKYGVDVGAVETDVDGQTVTLTIPASRVISHEIPEEGIQIFDEGRNLFNPVSIRDYVDFRAERKAEMEARAVEKGLPRSAQEKAGEALSAIVSAMPGMEAYTLEIRYTA